MKNKIHKQYLQSIKKPWLVKNNQQNIIIKINEKYTLFCCKYLPRSIRKTIFSISYKTSNIFSRLVHLLIQLSYRSYIIQGKDTYNQKLTILGFNNEDRFPYLKKILFLDNPSFKEKEKTIIIKIDKRINQIDNVDAIIIKTDIFFSGYIEFRYKRTIRKNIIPFFKKC